MTDAFAPVNNLAQLKSFTAIERGKNCADFAGLQPLGFMASRRLAYIWEVYLSVGQR